MKYGVTGQLTIEHSKDRQYTETRQLPYFELEAYSASVADEKARQIMDPESRYGAQLIVTAVAL